MSCWFASCDDHVTFRRSPAQLSRRGCSQSYQPPLHDVQRGAAVREEDRIGHCGGRGPRLALVCYLPLSPLSPLSPSPRSPSLPLSSSLSLSLLLPLSLHSSSYNCTEQQKAAYFSLSLQIREETLLTTNHQPDNPTLFSTIIDPLHPKFTVFKKQLKLNDQT